MNSGGDRFVETAVLARRYPDGEDPDHRAASARCCSTARATPTPPRFLAAFGIPRERLIIENKSRNTAENAAFSKEMVSPQPGENWLLVTSAFHMPRSVGLFRKVGFPVIPWPVDYRTSGRGRDRTVPRQACQFTAQHDHGHPRMDRPVRLLALRPHRALFPAPG